MVLVGNCTKAQYDQLLPLFQKLPVVVVGIVAHYRNCFDHVTYSNRNPLAWRWSICGKRPYRIGYL